MPDSDLVNRFPRVRLMNGPTPIQQLSHLEKVLGERRKGVSIWVKRDDLMELGGGGNKLRKLEFLLGEAMAEGCDTVVVTGGIQSNFARLAAAACARTGLACEVVLAQMVPRETEIYQANGNVVLDRLFGAHVHILELGDDAGGFALRRAAEIAASGGKAFVGTLGGSTPVGALGYVGCAFEIESQSTEIGTPFDQVVIPNGSGGMHAGLVAGAAISGRDPFQIRAHTVLSPADACVAATAGKVNAVFELFGSKARIQAEDLNINGTQLGGGYGIPTSEMVGAVKLVGRSEGLLLDPVYGGKAFAGLLSDIETEVIAPGSNVLFIMTGGSPGLFAYADALNSN
ncbi:D-cysteine desulfhydrase family protein [Mesorhizobium sp. L2C084A000]|uniref:D-cysteine desulfhydrase family protein n=1 Tax=Mesorhizobium sp. L2C084A000 TaxID=1287116 RepID=UPI0003D0638F|nr:D-cysteine desulfhydrase family protein [Mesorhizobium sp. L2C084A000]ESZ24048.1 cytochrome C biogenesis protein CcmE [Mesorhizobium sp. L2C084A000]